MTDTRIRDARKQTKLTQAQLAERYQIPRRTLQDWETGQHTPPEYVVNLLLRCIEVDFDVKLIARTQNDNAKKHTFYYTDGTPLSLVDEMYVRTENTSKMVELIKINDITGIRTYKCKSNGFIFNVKIS